MKTIPGTREQCPMGFSFSGLVSQNYSEFFIQHHFMEGKLHSCEKCKIVLIEKPGRKLYYFMYLNFELEVVVFTSKLKTPNPTENE